MDYKNKFYKNKFYKIDEPIVETHDIIKLLNITYNDEPPPEKPKPIKITKKNKDFIIYF